MVADRGSRALVIGTSVSAVIATAAVDGWIVPRSAVLRDDDGAHVFVVRASHAQRIAVRIVGETTAHYAIEGAMPVQPSVVVEGNYELSDGMPVREAQTR